MRRGRSRTLYFSSELWKRLVALRKHGSVSEIIEAMTRACIDDVEEQLPHRRKLTLNGKKVEI